MMFKHRALLDEHFRESAAHPTCVICNLGFFDSLGFDQVLQLTHLR